MTDWLRSLLQRKPRHYAGWLEGRDPMNIGALWQEMYRSEYFEGGRVLTAAISAIDIALYDIKGKALGLPVWQLLGGKHRDYVDTFASVRATETRRVIELTQQLLEAGWTCVRLPRAEGPAGNPSIFDPWQSLIVTAVSLAKVRETVGPGVILGIDYHHQLSVAEAASFCQRMPPGTLDWIEEPIRDEGPEAYESLRRMTPIPFALVEVPVGFKWFTKGLLDGTMGFAGEDSGGASFLRQDGTAWITDRDGLIVGLLAAEITARTETNPAAAYDRIEHELGQSWYERTDAPKTAAQRMQLKALTPEGIGMAELAGEEVRATITAAPGNGAPIGGVKVVADDCWFAARPSGTEDISKIYAESFRGETHLREVQQAAQDALARVFREPAPAAAA